MSIASARLASQLLIEGREPAEVVSHFGAMQGQDLPGVMTSIALRTRKRSLAPVTDAFNAGEIVRTWPQRGTLHVVGADRVRDVLAVARVRTFPMTVRRREQLGIDEHILAAARSVAYESIGTGITRSDLVDAWSRAGLITTGRAYHLIFHLSLEGLLVWGPMAGKEQLLVLLDEWAPPSQEKSYDKAVRDIVTRYVASHAPATRRDIGWWANLPMRDVDRALAESGAREEDGYWWGPEDPGEASARSLHALPGFDEMLLGYADRSASLSPERAQDICPGNNGVFKPTIMLGGKVIGTWQRKGLAADFFEAPSEALRRRTERVLATLPADSRSST